MVKNDHSIPNTQEIVRHLHCPQCLIEAAEGLKPVEQRLEVGWTPRGIQVWCKHHQMNVIHIDFEGQQHPANKAGGQGAGIFTEEHRRKLLEIKSDEPIVKRPFHEAVVDAISQASSRDLESLATLIKATSIPKGHDEIIVAWNRRRQDMCWGNEDLGVPASLLEQKEASLKKSTS